MDRKMLLAFVISLLLMSGHSFAQSNEIGFLVGGTLSPDTGPLSGVACITTDPNCASANHTSGQISYEGVFAHRIANLHLASVYIELPVVGIPNRTIRHTSFLPGTITASESFSSIFFTPSLKLKLTGPGISPFFSIGGGFAHLSSGANSFTGSTGASSTKGVFQAGGGVDINTPVAFLGLRGEAREFYTGDPTELRLRTSRHTIFIGGGPVLHF